MRPRQESTMAGMASGRPDFSTGTKAEHDADHAKVRWQDASAITAQLGKITGSIVTHELQDTFGVEVVRMENGELRQKYVGLDDQRKPIPHWAAVQEDVLAYIKQFGTEIEERKEVAINLEAVKWMKNTAPQLERGGLVVVDYGMGHAPSMDKALWTFPPDYDPVEHPGQLDITSHVDFGALRAAGEQLGLATDLFASDVDFIMAVDPEVRYYARDMYAKAAEIIPRKQGPAFPTLAVLVTSRGVSLDFSLAV